MKPDSRLSEDLQFKTCEAGNGGPAVDRGWVQEAIAAIRAEANRCGETNMIKLEIEGLNYVDIYLKDESAHPSGSLKHRLAQSLFLLGLCSGKIGPETQIVECSSGSTAISEAYFADLLGLPFTAVVPKTTASRKVELIERYNGVCERVPAHQIYACAEEIAACGNAHYMDQFTYAERATDWRSSSCIAAAIFDQLATEPNPIPEWIVVSAGTGGTSTTIGRHLRYARPECRTKLCVVDPENSVFFDYFRTGDASLRSQIPSRIEGIGRPRVEPSFFPELIDRMMRASDSASIAALSWLEQLTGRRFGGSTGTNFFGAYQLAQELEARKTKASIVTLICDGGERYEDTYYNPDWLNEQKLCPDHFRALSPKRRGEHKARRT